MDAPDRFALAEFLPYRFAVLAARMSRRLAAEYGARFGLDIPEWRVIAHLAEAGSVSVREIHLRADLEKPRVSRAVARLVRRGLVAKAPGAADRRLVALALTPEGWRVHAGVVPLARAFEAEVLALLDPAARAGLAAALARLEAGLVPGRGGN